MPLKDEISEEVVERMVALVHGVAEWEPDGYAVGQLANASERATEARAIAALLPKPVDPDLIEAREMQAEEWGDCASVDVLRYLRQGEYDTSKSVQRYYRCLKRGRELAKQEASK